MSNTTLTMALAGALLLALFAVPWLRRHTLAPLVVRLFRRVMPRIGATERVALDAGTVFWDGDLFSGDPDWRKLLGFEVKPLDDRERAFLAGPVERLCAMLNEWEVEKTNDLPPAVWAFLKTEKFFGMVIPQNYGGLGFSAEAHSAVVAKIASRSITAAVTVMVPNSLGPAELLLRYGTDAQKREYLPKLAAGTEIPCFALTGPEAGSDAAATQSTGVVCQGTWQGQQVLGVRLDWNKRYITLAPVATLIGLAFRLKDPQALLGGTEDLGITCALVPRTLPGISIGDRHDPMGVPFQNGPTEGRQVFIPIDLLIGGRDGAGQGWRMLMETLAAGRGISLPALSVGAAKVAARLVSAYGLVREQFDTPIGRFEGVEEPLARIAGMTYVMEAARRITCAAIDAGERPAVASAIVKAYLTEGMRKVVTDAMDIRAGAGICRGPRNVLARAYTSAPIAITVEGANILTRSMIIYGQGAIRCHPFVREEMIAAAEKDATRFERAFLGHLGFVVRNALRTWHRGVLGGRLSGPGSVRRPVRGLAGRLSRLSAAFALLSDATMATVGGKLKRREKLSGRLADALAWLYLGTATLKKFVDDGQRDADLPLVRWGLEQASFNVQEALRDLLDNLPFRPAAWLLRPLVFPWGARLRPPSDERGAQVAHALLDDESVRARLTDGIYLPPAGEPGLGRLEDALVSCKDALGIEARIRAAVRKGTIDRAPGDAAADLALAAGIITADERARLREADKARDEAIQVDSFVPQGRLTTLAPATDQMHVPPRSERPRPPLFRG